MNRHEQQLLALYTIPVVMVVVLCVAMLYRKPDFINLAIALTTTLLALLLISVGFAWHRRTFVLKSRPLPEDAATKVERPEGRLLIQQDQEIQQLRTTIARLDADNRLIEAQLTGQEARAELLANACNIALGNVIGFTNLLTGVGRYNREFLAGITCHVTTLGVLLREFGDLKPEVCRVGTFDIRQLVDDCLGALACTGRNRILPFFSPGDPFLLEGDADTLTSLVFNYLLINTRPGDDRVLSLAVHQSKPGFFTFSLPLAEIQQDARHARLLTANQGTMHGSEVVVPVRERTTMPSLPGLTAWVVTDHVDEERALSRRLESMGLRIVRDHRRADICLISTEDMKDISAILDKLRPDTMVLTTKNRSPIKRRNTIQLRWPVQHAELTALLAERATESRSARPLALVADDSATSVTLVSSHLEDLDFDVVAVNNGDDAILYAGRQRFSLVILDVNMPATGGIDAVDAIRERLSDDTPILLSSAQVTEEDARRINATSATGLLMKPVTKRDLTQYIKRKSPQRRIRNESATDILDRKLALKLANERPELAQELLEILMETLEQDRTDIKSAWAASDRATFRSLVHRLNGGLRYSGVPRLRNAVAKLETMSRSANRRDTEQALNLFNREVDALKDFYEPRKQYFSSE